MRFLSVINFVECVYHSSLEHFISNETLRKADIQYVQSDHQNEWRQSMDPNRIYVVGSKAVENASTTAETKDCVYVCTRFYFWDQHIFSATYCTFGTDYFF